MLLSSSVGHRVTSLLLTVVCLFFASFGNAAETDKYVGQRIDEIRFASEDPLDTSRLDEIIPVSAGKDLSPLGIRESIRILYETREFAYIEVDASRSNGSLIMTFKLRPNFFFADFRLGGDFILRSPLSSLAQLPLGEVYSPKIVQNLLGQVRQALQNAGYYQAEVVPNIQFLSQRRLVTVEFLVKAGPRAVVSEINLSGSPLLEKAEILNQMKLKAGRPFHNDILKRDFERLRKLYSDRGFLNATIRLEKLAYSERDNSLKVDLYIDASAFVYIELTGAKIPAKQLRNLVPIYEEGSIDQDLIEEGKRNIEDYFERQGLFDVAVMYELIEVPSENAYQINYRIDRGEKQKVVSIQFEGAGYFNQNQLLAPLSMKVGGLTSRGKFSRDLMGQDAEVIKSIYLREGFEQVQVRPEFEKDASGKNVAITFEIKEGPQTYVAEIETRGNQVVSREVLMVGSVLGPGRPFSAAALDEDRRLLESKYLDRGFVDVKVEADVERYPEGRVRIVYRVNEGNLWRVDDIHIIGSQRTKNKVIGRSINFHEGDPLSQDRFLTSQQRLYNLGLFNRVDIAPFNVNPVDSYKPVIIRLEDASPIILGYGVGYQDREGVRGTVEISHNNLFGLARSISFRTRASFGCFFRDTQACNQRGQITYKEPRLFNRDLDSFVSLFVENAELNRPFNTLRTNASIQVLKRFSQIDNFFIRYNFETVDLSDVIINPLATRQEDTLNLSSFSTAWLRDTRDDPFDPTKGFFHTANFSVASKLYGSEANLASFFVQTQSHLRVRENIVLASSLRLGLTKPFGSTLEVPISERFFAGGSTSLRGFNVDCAGPLAILTRTPENEEQAKRINCGGPSDSQFYAPLGGNALFIANFELRIPVTKSFSFVPFYDTGNSFSKIGSLRLSEFTHTLGFGVRYKTPFGPLRVDLGFNLDRPAGVPNRQIFFTIGNPF